MTDPVSDFLDAMGAAGIRPLEPIAHRLVHGQPVRFRAEGDRLGRRNGWAVLHLDGLPSGVFRHYRLGIRQTWRAGCDSRTLSADERRTLKMQAQARDARRKVEAEAKRNAAAGLAIDLWQGAGNADPAHAYLVRKRLPPFGIRQMNDQLLIPMIDLDLNLWNLQSIGPDGRKRYLTGGRTDGLFWSHGAVWHDALPLVGPIVIGEGFATMAAIHHATGLGVVAAMSAHNLGTIARAVRDRFPRRALLIAADDDRHLNENIGMNVARTAARSTGAYLVTPEPVQANSNSGHGVDFADLHPAAIIARFAQVEGGRP